MALPAFGPGVVFEIADLLPDDGVAMSCTSFKGYLLGAWREFHGGTAVGIQGRGAGVQPDLIEVQTDAVAAVDGVITLTCQPLLYNTSTTVANAVGGAYLYVAEVTVAGQTWPVKYEFRFLLDEDASYTVDGDGNVPFAEVASASELVALPDGAVIGVDVASQAGLDAVEDDVANLVTLSGRPVDSTDLGTFTGSTVADSATVKAALQSLETAVETKWATAGSLAGDVTGTLDATIVGDDSHSHTASTISDFSAAAVAAVSPLDGDRVVATRIFAR